VGQRNLGYTPLPPVLWNQQVTQKIPRDLWCQRTYRQNIPNKGLSVRCRRPQGTRSAS